MGKIVLRQHLSFFVQTPDLLKRRWPEITAAAFFHTHHTHTHTRDHGIVAKPETDHGDKCPAIERSISRCRFYRIKFLRAKVDNDGARAVKKRKKLWHARLAWHGFQLFEARISK
jgi:hypothetical protein